MLHKIFILIGKSQYDSKKHLSAKLAEAFNRKGIQTIFFDVLQPHAKEVLHTLLLREKPDLCCTFYPQDCRYLKLSFWKQLQIPFLILLIDPAPDWAFMNNSPLIYYACCDQYHSEFMIKHGKKNVFYLGHGVESDLAPAENQERPFDVVFFGSSYDPVGWKLKWKQFSDPIQKAMEKAAESYLSDSFTPFWQVVDEALQAQGVHLDRETLNNIYLRVLLYCHAWDRVELIRAVKDARVDVFGGTVFRQPIEAKSWHYYLLDKNNVHIHPSITLDEAIEVMKKSKICLNSMPYFKNGTHERLLTAAACGCLLITTDTVWTREQFTPDRDLILYEPYNWAEVNDKVNYYLSHEQERQEIAWNGRQKVMQAHTWDHRVTEILRYFRSQD